MSEGPAPRAAIPPDISVWDPLLRLTHWSFPLLIPAMWWTAETSKWGLHKRLGLVLLGLLVFRIIWGFVGPQTARFGQFVKGPRSVLAYLRGDTGVGVRTIGHSPLAGWSTVVLLGAMLLQASLGLFAGDPFDGTTGPLNGLVGTRLADTITELHEAFFWAIAGLVALHLAAITFYAAKGDDLLSPMVGGSIPPVAGVAGIGEVPWVKGLIASMLAACVALWLAYGAPPLT